MSGRRRDDRDWELSDEERLARQHRARLAPGKRTLSEQIVTAPGAAPPGIMLFASGAQPATPAPALSDQIGAANRSPAFPLPADLREQLEPALGVGLGGVRLHAGEESGAAAEGLAARAFALGQDVHFARGEFDPGSREGRKLIAHEVVHTVQQRGARLPP